MATDEIDPIHLAKQILWEEAKGKLRAMASAGGCGQNRIPEYEAVCQFIEEFIKELESNEYHY